MVWIVHQNQKSIGLFFCLSSSSKWLDFCSFWSMRTSIPSVGVKWHLEFFLGLKWNQNKRQNVFSHLRSNLEVPYAALCSVYAMGKSVQPHNSTKWIKMEGTIPQKCTVVASSPTSSSGNSIQDCFVTSLYLAQSGHPILRPGFIAWFCISKIDLP